MPRRGERRPKPLAGDPADPDGMAAWVLRFLEALRVKNYSERTVENREAYLGLFLEWCEPRGLTRAAQITRPILQRYQRHLFHYRHPRSGKALSVRAQYSRLMPLRAFFKWLTRENVLLSNPASELELPRLARRLPKHVLTTAEAEAILSQPDLEESFGLRDRAILEVFYSTGIRRSELLALSVYDIDPERGTLMVRLGKGKKDRMVPVGPRALAWTEKYLRELRPELATEPDDGALFLTRDGERFTPNRLSQLVRDYVNQADIGKTGSCHLWRHTCATLMMENGADIRYIQEMLGHAELSTTQIYTQVSIRKLKEIHTATHPASKLRREELPEELLEELREAELEDAEDLDE